MLGAVLVIPLVLWLRGVIRITRAGGLIHRLLLLTMVVLLVGTIGIIRGRKPALCQILYA
jgi:hypothetical protein